MSENGICPGCGARPGGEHAPDCRPPAFSDIYTKEDVVAMRKEMIGWRDASMNQWPDAIPFTVSSSHIIGWMTQAIEELYPNE